MIRNETVDQGQVIEYCEIERINNNVVVREWCKGQDETERPATQDEVYQLEFQENPPVEVVDEIRQIPASALDELAESMADPQVNSIAEVKNALASFISKIQ